VLRPAADATLSGFLKSIERDVLGPDHERRSRNAVRRASVTAYAGPEPPTAAYGG
jgi:hypothetical protein